MQNFEKGKIINQKYTSGFTLIEVLIVIGILAVLAGIVLVAINPARQFSQARDSQRVSNVASILNAIGQNIAENKGIFDCDNIEIPQVPDEDPKEIKSGNDGVNLYDCLVPDYLADLPFDPLHGHLNDSSDYNTAYNISKNEAGRITISASGEIEEEISVTR